MLLHFIVQFLDLFHRLGKSDEFSNHFSGDSEADGLDAPGDNSLANERKSISTDSALIASTCEKVQSRTELNC